MKRGWTNALCLAVVAVMASPALAVVNVQLNLRYTDPNNATGGGTWDLLVKSTATNGLAGISVVVNGALGVTGTDLPAGIITPNALVFDNTTSVFRYKLTSPGVTEIVAGDDLVAANLVLGVGTGGFTNRTIQDDLFVNASTSDTWDNSTRLASGSWTGARPTLGTIVANEFDTTAPTPKAVLATNGTLSVRGDSVVPDGLKKGDTDRNGVVNLSDLGTLAGKFGLNAGATWADGNFDSNGNVNLSDLGALAGNFGQSTTSPPIGAVPEPAAATLFALSSLAVLRAKRRRS